MTDRVEERNQMQDTTKVRLSIGLSGTARTRPLVDGRVGIEGVDADVVTMGVQALFNLQLTEHPFDVCEFPIASYLRTLETDDQPYLAIPVFPSRHFRLSCIFVAADADVATPADLAGKRIGLPVFDMAAAVWLRGILHDFHDLDRHAPIYVTAGIEEPRDGDEHPQVLPPGFTVERRSDAGLAQLLAAGEIDALYTARAPSTWPGPAVRRLFEDPRKVEQQYHAASGIFPAMHVLAIKRHLAEADPWLPEALYRAFGHAQIAARAELFDSSALDSILPWQLEELLESERVLGGDPWTSGFAANRPMLAQVIAYARADGLISGDLSPEDLFAGPGAETILAS